MLSSIIGDPRLSIVGSIISIDLGVRIVDGGHSESDEEFESVTGVDASDAGVRLKGSPIFSVLVNQLNKQRLQIIEATHQMPKGYEHL